jgi:hypothetical protein
MFQSGNIWHVQHASDLAGCLKIAFVEAVLISGWYSYH